MGGGNAMPNAVLKGLKKYDLDITSVTSMVDSGGSSGQLRKDFNVLPPGDMRRHLLALSEAPEWKKELFKFRFGREEFGDGHRGHSFGNAFIAGLEYVLKDYEEVLKIVHEFLEVKGRCLPATIEKTNLVAILENGQEIFGEDEIDVPKAHDPNLKIKKIFLKPEAKAYQPVSDAIENADLIIIGPGDLYSSLIPCVLPRGIKESLEKSKAKKILIVPAMTKIGETNGFSVLDFANEMERYVGSPLDFVIYNNFVPEKERVEKYKKEELNVHEIVEINEGIDEKRFIGRDLLVKSGEIVYDPDKLADVIIKNLTGQSVESR